MQHSANFASLVDFDPVLEEIFFQQYAQIPMMLATANGVFGVRTSSKAKETNKRVGGFGEPREFDGQVYYDEADSDYEITFSHTHFTLGFKVERTLLEDMQYENIFTEAGNLGQSFARKRVRDEASVFNNAFATVTGYDGKTLVATDHPRSQTDSTAVSNSMGTAALTDANLETAILQLENLGDDLGQETNAMGTTLLVGRANRKKARQLVESVQTPENANNSINTNTNLTAIVHPMITGNKWFVLDAPMARQTLKWYDRLLTSFASSDDLTNTLVRSYAGRMRYSFGWTDFRFVVGSNPS